MHYARRGTRYQAYCTRRRSASWKPMYRGSTWRLDYLYLRNAQQPWRSRVVHAPSVCHTLGGTAALIPILHDSKHWGATARHDHRNPSSLSLGIRPGMQSSHKQFHLASLLAWLGVTSWQGALRKNGTRYVFIEEWSGLISVFHSLSWMNTWIHSRRMKWSLKAHCQSVKSQKTISSRLLSRWTLDSKKREEQFSEKRWVSALSIPEEYIMMIKVSERQWSDFGVMRRLVAKPELQEYNLSWCMFIWAVTRNAKEQPALCISIRSWEKATTV